MLALDLSPSVPATVLALLWIGSPYSVIDAATSPRAGWERTGQAEFVKHGDAAHVDLLCTNSVAGGAR
ncbi:hypothetical protein ACFV8E_30770 [Streptomyces sp. NPDC059849]|uniref:hypothetical protein n=1 Tax=Streptomyces sp. NPDC059849 TaxID=3346969 RepID=UPI00365EB008